MRPNSIRRARWSWKTARRWPERAATRVDVVRYDLNQIAFDVSSDRPAYLVLSDVYHPDWRATIDGAPAPIYSADFAFRAVFLPAAGSYRVDMRFVPRGWRAGVGLTAGTLLLLLAVALGLRRNRALPGLNADPASTESSTGK